MAPTSSQLFCPGNCSPSPGLSGTRWFCALCTDSKYCGKYSHKERENNAIPDQADSPPQTLLSNSRKQEILKKCTHWGKSSWMYLLDEQGQNQPGSLDVNDSLLPSSPWLNFLLLLETWYNNIFINPGHSKGIAEIQQLHQHQEIPTEERPSTYSLKVKYTSPKTKAHFTYYAFKRWKIAFQRPECAPRREHRRENSSFHLQEVKRPFMPKPSSWEATAGIVSSIWLRTRKYMKPHSIVEWQCLLVQILSTILTPSFCKHKK